MSLFICVALRGKIEMVKSIWNLLPEWVQLEHKFVRVSQCGNVLG